MLALLFGLLCQPPQEALPLLVLKQDNTAITTSVRIQIPPGLVIADRDGNGVLHVRPQGDAPLVVQFDQGSVLRGTERTDAPETYQGVGIHLEGGSDVVLRNLQVEGFHTGLIARRSTRLTLEDAVFQDLWRQRLGSTRAAEDPRDWLAPHANDEEEWRTRYGAAVWLSRCDAPTLRRNRVRTGQNGFLLSRISGAKIYDNDASFLSGWGIGLWRSSDNLISRNAFDFCVRGYSHGIYNRGQDSAGILIFEQCNRNRFLENSATHGGDGVFGFGGQAALASEDRLGCNANLFAGNDFSYAVAHGLEMTFSFDNQILTNRFVENAICGIWGGYSQSTLIAGNHFAGNGDMAYGLERGGINIEHGTQNHIAHNTFDQNLCGIHLWDDPDEELLKKPWAQANHKGCIDNRITANRFRQNTVAIQFREAKGSTLQGNQFEGNTQDIDADAKSQSNLVREPVTELIVPDHEAIGQSRPVGARPHLQGRQHIIMQPYGPWDHRSPLIRPLVQTGSAHTYDLLQFAEPVEWGAPALPLQGRLSEGEKPGHYRLHIESPAPGIHPYAVPIKSGQHTETLRGQIIHTSWEVAFFNWTKDPRKDLASFRRQALSATAVRLNLPDLKLEFGMGAPRDLDLPALSKARLAQIGKDRFGLIAKTVVPIPAGTWKIKTLSDDGIRVLVDGQPVIENWTWHGPTPDEGRFEVKSPRAVTIVVEHFELDGFSTLAFAIESAP